MNKVGWAAYARQGLLFVKRIPYDPKAAYTDHGSNTEVYTEARFFEVESLGPLVTLVPGQTAMPQGTLVLFAGMTIPKDDAELEKTLAPIIAKTTP